MFAKQWYAFSSHLKNKNRFILKGKSKKNECIMPERAITKSRNEMDMNMNLSLTLMSEESEMI